MTTTKIGPQDQAVDPDNRIRKARGKAVRSDDRRDDERTRGESRIEQDPVLALLANLPVDDEPLTDDDRQDIREGWRAYRGGSTISAEEAKHACRDARGVRNGSKAKKSPA